MQYWRNLRQDKDDLVDVRQEVTRQEGPAAHAITRVGAFISNPLFFGCAVLVHLGWILLNLPAISPLPPWDPPPFMLLATIASVEAPLLALLILMRQQQDRRVAELREDTDLQTTLHAERETTKLLQMLDQGHQSLGIQRDPDPELERMMKPLDPDKLVRHLEAEMEERRDEPGQD